MDFDPNVMPVINIDEKIGKTVGRRTAPPRDPFKYAMGLQRVAGYLAKETWGRGLCPRGVFRFKSHEEADEWMLKMLTRPMKPRS
jgi:hypothetical protein